MKCSNTLFNGNAARAERAVINWQQVTGPLQYNSIQFQNMLKNAATRRLVVAMMHRKRGIYNRCDVQMSCFIGENYIVRHALRI